MLSAERLDQLQKLAERKGRSLRKEAENVGFGRHWGIEFMRDDTADRLEKWLLSFPDKATR